jgi:flagellar biosynthesis/type III secretory pathway chaperone
MQTMTADQCVALVRRLKQHLLLQRVALCEYLDLLEREESVIREGDEEGLQSHVESEAGLVRQLEQFQKVIDPLLALYRFSFPNGEAEIPPLRDSIERIQHDVLLRNQRNRELLRSHVEDLRRRIDEFKSRSGVRLSPFLSAPSALVDVTV